MLGGNNHNTAHPVFLAENRIQYPATASDQLQLFGNIPVGCAADPVNYFGGDHNNNNNTFRPNKRAREAEVISRQQKLQISLNNNNNICNDEADRVAGIPIQNPVSTGLRLSYDDDERNSSITSASGSITVAPAMLLSLGDNLKAELDRQKEEFDQYIKTQEENLVKGVKDIKHRHMASFLTAIEKSISKKLHEKDYEIDSINRKNKELVERMKQVAVEAQNWHYRAKYNESVVNILKTNLQQALSRGAEQMKEGFGDSEIDDTATCNNPNNFLSVIPSFPAKKSVSMKDSNIICRVCKTKGVSFLLMPCRHLCLCKDCERVVNICPVCQLMRTASVRVYLS